MEKKQTTRIFRLADLPFMEIKTGAGTTYAVRKHSHDTLSIGFVEKGSSKIICQPHKFNLETHNATLIPPGNIHLCEPDDADKFIFRMVYICPDWLASTFELDAHKLQPQARALSKEDIVYKDTFFTPFNSGRDKMVEETRVIFFLAHLFFSVFSLEPATDKYLTEPETINRVTEFLDNNFSQEIQLDDLENLTGISKFSLLRRFKKRWHLTPHAYVINKRILMAKKMLKQNYSVADTAAACGFFDQSHFVKTFKNFVGINPAAYKS